MLEEPETPAEYAPPVSQGEEDERKEGVELLQDLGRV